MPTIHKIQDCQDQVCKVEIKSDGTHVEVLRDGSEKVLPKADLALHDCLGCNGCQQEDGNDFVQRQDVHKEFIDILRSPDSRTRVVSISPQARASLAVYYDLVPEELVGKLVTFFKQHGFAHVFDTSFARDMALLETGKDFISRKRRGEKLPLIVSSCPGVVTYAELTHATAMLPLLSTVRSPHQVMGSLVKDQFRRLDGLRASDVFHVTIMPCLDRRNEASREEYFDTEFQSKEVDMVLTSQDLVKVIQEMQTDFPSLRSSSLPERYTNIKDGKFFWNGGGPSDGYLEFVYRLAAKELHGIELGPLVFSESRNGNLKEVELKINDKVVLKFASAYGFKNMQTILRKMKAGTCDYDFLELMACPGGCTNGGGQILPSAKAETPEQLLKRVNELYFSIPVATISDEVLTLYNALTCSEDDSDDAYRLFHTSYKVLDPEEEARKTAGTKAKSTCGCGTKKKQENFSELF